MRRKKRGEPGKAARLLLLAALLAAAVALALALWSAGCRSSTTRRPVYLPRGDVVFLPRG